MKHITIILTVVLTFLLSACVTMQTDIHIDHQRSVTEQYLVDVETAIIPLEAAISTGGQNEIRRLQREITDARQMISNMEREVSADADFTGQLIAWSGRLAIIEGRYSEAVRLQRQSTSVSPGNFPLIILGIRLEGDPARRLEIIDREIAASSQRAAFASGSGELNIERGRTLFDLNRFSEAAGAFDTAFAAEINPVYRESYTNVRNRAWELRNTSGVETATIGVLVQESLTWNDCLRLITAETQLLRFITGGRTIPDAELFTRLVDRAFIPFTQDVTISEWPTARPRAAETVTRAGAAWLIWHLHAEARGDRGLLSRYSARYATGANPRSPITDLPPLSPFFDSILGCVESEFMSLPDARNFRPTQPIRGAELLTILRRIDR